MSRAIKTIRKFIVAIAGFTVLLAGVALLVLPGPGILVIIAGLAILALEFAWADRYLQIAKDKASKIAKKTKSTTKK